MAAGCAVAGLLVVPVPAAAEPQPARPQCAVPLFTQAQEVLTPVQALPSLGVARRLASGAGVTVGIIDTGVLPGPDLPHLEGVADLVGADPGRTRGLTDCDLHGSIVARIIGSSQVGVAPDARLLSIRQVTNLDTPNPKSPFTDPQDPGAGTIAGLAHAITTLADKGAEVINISVSTCTPAGTYPAGIPALTAAMDRAEEKGVVVVAAAGNTSATCTPGMDAYPAAEPRVVSVAATGADAHTVAPYSLTHALMAAPGGPVTVPLPQAQAGAQAGAELRNVTAAGDPTTQPPTPRALIGTSFASPLVAGVAALIKEVAPGLTAAQVRQALADSARPSSAGKAGHIDAAAAVTTALDMAQSRGEVRAVAGRQVRRLQPPGARPGIPVTAGIGLGLVGSCGAVCGLWVVVRQRSGRRQCDA